MYKKIDISNEINDLERYNIFSTMMSRIFFTCEVAYSGASTRFFFYKNILNRAWLHVLNNYGF